MYKISDFAALGLVSAKMLRHYATISLLTPTYTDPLTGYRYYTVDQLKRLNWIVALKDLGFSLEQIAALIDSGLSADQFHDTLLERRAEVRSASPRSTGASPTLRRSDPPTRCCFGPSPQCPPSPAA